MVNKTLIPSAIQKVISGNPKIKGINQFHNTIIIKGIIDSNNKIIIIMRLIPIHSYIFFSFIKW
jgi:uncharacterized membrane protein YdjX (TVP38/TMEM64 family)